MSAIQSQARHLRAIDTALADFLARQFPAASQTQCQLAALVSYQLADGHLGLPLATSGDSDYWLNEAKALLPMATHAVFLADSDTILEPCKNPLLSEDGSTPLVKQDGFIYLNRYWRMEREICQWVKARLQHNFYHEAGITTAVLQAQMAKIYPQLPTVKPSQELPDWQQIACVLAPRKGMGIITGGPGTGKTYTVLRLLALQQLIQKAKGLPWLSIKLAAPTGKAADRLAKSIHTEMGMLRFQGLAADVLDALPVEAQTLHRLLGTRRHSRHFYHDDKRPLEADMVIVDEASMLDIDMLHALLRALPPACRLILVGDKDQLASVEPGAVMQDLCYQADQAYSRPTYEFLRALGMDMAPVRDHVMDSALHNQTIKLYDSRRAASAPWIIKLAKAINAGEPARCLIEQEADENLHIAKWRPQDDTWIQEQLFAPDAGIGQLLITMQKSRPQEMQKQAIDQWAAELLDRLGQQQLLTPMRVGPVGVDALNQRIRHFILRHYPAHNGKQKPAVGASYFAGEPLLVMRNLYELGVMNGDMGLVLDYPGRGLRVAFTDGVDDAGNTRIRWLLPEQLEAGTQGGYAITVHQAQGSGFANTLLMLPEHWSPVLSRELLYTAVTRSSRRFVLIESAEATGSKLFDQASSTATERHSALYKNLHAKKDHCDEG